MQTFYNRQEWAYIQYSDKDCLYTNKRTTAVAAATTTITTTTTTTLMCESDMRRSLPWKASSISSSVGVALFRRREYMDMTNPGVQNPHWDPWAFAILSCSPISSMRQEHRKTLIPKPDRDVKWSWCCQSLPLWSLPGRELHSVGSDKQRPHSAPPPCPPSALRSWRCRNHIHLHHSPAWILLDPLHSMVKEELESLQRAMFLHKTSIRRAFTDLL